MKNERLLQLTKLVFFLGAFAVFAAGQANKQVFLNVEVLSRDYQPVGDLKAEHFRVFEDKKPLEITYFGSENLPLSIGFLIDASPSMTDAELDKTDLIRKGLVTFIENSNAQNEYFVAAFAKKVDVLSEFADAAETTKTIVSHPYFKNGHGATTALYDAVNLGIENLSKAKNQKRILIVCGDGRDTDSAKRYKDIEQLVKDKNDIVYFIGFQSVEYESTPPIAKIAELSGGRAYYPYYPSFNRGAVPNTALLSSQIFLSEEKMLDRFARFAGRLQKHYVIGFKPNLDKAENKWRNLEVKLEIPKELKKKIGLTTVRARDGYFPSSELVRSN